MHTPALKTCATATDRQLAECIIHRSRALLDEVRHSPPGFPTPRNQLIANDGPLVKCQAVVVPRRVALVEGLHFVREWIVQLQPHLIRIRRVRGDVGEASADDRPWFIDTLVDKQVVPEPRCVAQTPPPVPVDSG